MSAIISSVPVSIPIIERFLSGVKDLYVNINVTISVKSWYLSNVVLLEILVSYNNLLSTYVRYMCIIVNGMQKPAKKFIA